MKFHDDGPDHVVEDGLPAALCDVRPDGDLLPPDGDRCFRCVMQLASMLVDVPGADW